MYGVIWGNSSGDAFIFSIHLQTGMADSLSTTEEVSPEDYNTGQGESKATDEQLARQRVALPKSSA